MTRPNYSRLPRIVDGETWLPIGQVAQRVNRLPIQVKRWCEFWDRTTGDVRERVPHPLPEFRRDLDDRDTRYFRESDLPALRKFRDQIGYGFFRDLDDATWREVTKKGEKDDGAS